MSGEALNVEPLKHADKRFSLMLGAAVGAGYPNSFGKLLRCMSMLWLSWGWSNWHEGNY